VLHHLMSAIRTSHFTTMTMNRPSINSVGRLIFLCTLPLLTGCQEDDPQVTPLPDTGLPDNGDAVSGEVSSETDATADGTTADASADASADTANGQDATSDTDALGDATSDASEADVVVPVSCEPLATDYSVASNESWAACAPDGGTYVAFEATISTIARIDAYEAMATLLWDNANVPTPEDFLAARELYATDEGLGSRVARREDEHYPPVTDATGAVLSCRNEGVPALDPDRCVGPAQMLPLINDAFVAGINGADPVVNAARLDATLIWFLYLSTYKEAITCTSVKKDCDSSWAYYNGGTQPEEPARGLGRLVDTAAPQTHDRINDGIFAVRCWRDIDSAEVATDIALRDQALLQLDTALLHGMAKLVLERMTDLETATGVDRDADWAWLQIVGSALVREASDRDPAAAVVIETAFASSTPETVDLPAVREAISATFPCP
jgi:hypothetical protein